MSDAGEIQGRLERIDEQIIALGDILHSLAGLMSDDARDRLVNELETDLAADPDRPIGNDEIVSELPGNLDLPA